ncbi:bifunctional adenosylcobinamide kinase/adenosylcobinamide-phosphate guanylyltransferase [Kushneria aurantia]|uniref:Bifunctional adenosylcobalamin biosynthesis protein n=1 Tax=Kushneria aurantia TaxID=504092 RepID=A0ABV6G4F1_9GAMM|nr:bifunctional adenosylcobinamide kinase/adenosylcobinamide-phosphate guanylyltransferase [Kushneria aurantia]
MKELILGGARSGKSAFAERLAQRSGLAVTYIATAEVGEDSEMRARIAAHRRRRPAHWALEETPRQLGETLKRCAAPGRLVLIDCLTLWLTNLLLAEEGRMANELERFEQALAAAPGPVLLVSNEVGQGVVPIDALSRRFVDETGQLHQRLAQQCERVWWVVAGLPQRLKGPTDE